MDLDYSRLYNYYSTNEGRIDLVKSFAKRPSQRNKRVCLIYDGNVVQCQGRIVLCYKKQNAIIENKHKCVVISTIFSSQNYGR
jgi:hypothetical protein